jgi:hypothetical protein
MEPPVPGANYWLHVEKMDSTLVTAYGALIPSDSWSISSSVFYLPVGTYITSFRYSSETNIIATDIFTVSLNEAEDEEEVWVRTQEMTCKQVWVNEDNMFQFSFIYPYRDNNWIRIYDMAGNMVYETDMPYDNPNIIVDLPDGMYTVKTFNDQPEPIQTFIIGKP